jgi:hypothetical protein
MAKVGRPPRWLYLEVKADPTAMTTAPQLSTRRNRMRAAAGAGAIWAVRGSECRSGAPIRGQTHYLTDSRDWGRPSQAQESSSHEAQLRCCHAAHGEGLAGTPAADFGVGVLPYGLRVVTSRPDADAWVAAAVSSSVLTYSVAASVRGAFSEIERRTRRYAAVSCRPRAWTLLGSGRLAG